jgi:hypothetical protein
LWWTQLDQLDFDLELRRLDHRNDQRVRDQWLGIDRNRQLRLQLRLQVGLWDGSLQRRHGKLDRQLGQLRLRIVRARRGSGGRRLCSRDLPSDR